VNYNVLALNEFKKNTKKLSKRYKKIKFDILALIEQLESDPHIGTHLFSNCYKIRLANSSVLTGKSGGFRVITFIDETSNVYLLTIYSKSDQDNISDAKIVDLIKSIENEFQN